MAPEDAASAFRAKFRVAELTVHETADWTLSVRPAQPVLGALVISTRHGALDFSQVPEASGAGLLRIIGQAETTARRELGAVRLNALCLMMQDPLFHLHLLPRYGDPVEFGGRAWIDRGWPGPPALGDTQASGDGELFEILRTYRAHDWR